MARVFRNCADFVAETRFEARRGAPGWESSGPTAEKVSSSCVSYTPRSFALEKIVFKVIAGTDHLPGRDLLPGRQHGKRLCFAT